MGSQSDWPHMRGAAQVLHDLGVTYETAVVSAHRTPDRLTAYAKAAQGRGLQLIIAGAGGAAHLPGMLAASTVLPVIGVPVPSSFLNGLDSLLSVVQMPFGVPVATMAAGSGGAKNAALFAVSVLALQCAKLHSALAHFKAQQTNAVAWHVAVDDNLARPTVLAQDNTQ